MSGTDDPRHGDIDPPEGRNTSDLIRMLTRAGMLCYVGWLLFFFRQLERVFRVSPQQFAGLWDQRLEVMSFVVLPPNIVILMPAAVCAVAATWIAGPAQSLDLAILLRLTRWSANLMAAIAVASGFSTLITESGSSTRFGDTAIRVGAAMFAVATSQACHAAGRRAPGG